MDEENFEKHELNDNESIVEGQISLDETLGDNRNIIEGQISMDEMLENKNEVEKKEEIPVKAVDTEETKEKVHSYYEEHLRKEAEKGIENTDNSNTVLKWVCGILAIALIISIGALIFMRTPNHTKNLKNNTGILVSDRENNAVVNTVQYHSDGKIYTASEIYQNNINSVVIVETEVAKRGLFNQIQYGTGLGSGFIISKDGYIVTNHHVVDGASSVKVITYDGKEYEASVIGSESDNDVAVIKIQSEEDFIPVVLGDSDKMLVGEDIVVIGNSLGEFEYSMCKGIVSGLNRNVRIDSENIINVFQVDCPINEGNSGGPILNMYGEVVGFVSAKYASTLIEGIGFCIPISDVKGIIEDIIQYGKVTNKAYMGVIVRDVEIADIEKYNLVEGAFIYSIETGSPADKVGLKQGDIIVEFEGKPIKSVSELLLAKRAYRAGDTVKIKVWRSGEYKEVILTFIEYNEEEVAKLIPNNDIYSESPSQEEYNQYPSIEDYFRDYFFNH